MNNNCILSIAEMSEKLLDSLFSIEPSVDYSSYSTEEIIALSIAVVSHRRMIKTASFNALLREFDLRKGYQYSSPKMMSIFREVQKLLEVRSFNFQTSEIIIECSIESTRKLLELSRESRLSNPRVQYEIQKQSREIAKRLQAECYGISVDVNDIAQELQIYMIGSAEANYDPTKSSYVTYAITTLRFRSKIVLNTARLLNSREMLTSFENTEDNNYESLQVDESSSKGMSNSYGEHEYASNGLSDHQYNIKHSISMMFQTCSPLTKALMYLKHPLKCNISAFGFDASSILDKSTQSMREHLGITKAMRGMRETIAN